MNHIDKAIADGHFAMISYEKVKNEPCYKCGVVVEVDSDYEPEGCCNSFECGCMGMQTNPVFCDECYSKL